MLLHRAVCNGKRSGDESGANRQVVQKRGFTVYGIPLSHVLGLWLGLPACIEEFDNMIKDFFKSDFKEDRQEIVDKAQQMADAIKEESKKTRGQVYVKTMQKVIEKGDHFISQELARVEKLKDEKVSDKKKAQLRDRANILTSFHMRMKGEVLSHEEL